jgi:hypothetical protein
MRQADVMAWLKSVYKPGFLEELEAWFDPSDPEVLRERYDEAIASLDSSDPNDWMTPAAGVGVPDEDREHFDGHWLGNTDPNWSGIAPSTMLTEMRTGFAAAMRDAREYGLPMNYVWVAPDPLAKDYFEVSHVVGPNSVTAVIVTSKPEADLS